MIGSVEPPSVHYALIWLFQKYSTLGLEWKLSELGAIKTSLKKDPSANKEIRDVLTASLQGTAAGYKDPDDSDED